MNCLWCRAFVWMLILAACAATSGAHELQPGFLRINQTGPETLDVLWKVPTGLELDVRLPPACEDVGERTIYQTDDGQVQRWRVNYSAGLVGETIHVDGLADTLTDVLVRLQWRDGRTQTIRLDATTPSFVVEETPSWLQVATSYTMMGVEHILLGIDHLLFVLGLLLIVRGTGRLIKTITAFTIAHSISLALAVFGVVHVSPRPVDAAIALSIVFLGAEILQARDGRENLTVRFPWIVAFAFGLLHGLGFAGALTGLGLPATDIPIALLFFNVGVEIGQLMFVAFFLSLTWSFRTLEVRWPTWTQSVPAYAIGTMAMYWFIGRLFVMMPFA